MRFSNTLMLTTLFSCCVGASLHSQNNQWTWVSGNKIVDHSINYGTKGVAAATNYPGSRSGSIRFSDNKDQRESTTISKATVELIAGMGEVGLLAGLDHVVTVYDAFLRRIIRQTGCNETLVGQPVRFGRVQTYAGLFDIDAIQLAAFKKVWNLPETLIDQDSRLRLFAAA